MTSPSVLTHSKGSSTLNTLLGNAAAGASALAWQKHCAALPNPACHDDNVEEYAFGLGSVDAVQCWLNACSAGVAKALPLSRACSVCETYNDTMWNALVQYHAPQWRRVVPDEWLVLADGLARYAKTPRCIARFEALWAGLMHADCKPEQAWDWRPVAARAVSLSAMQHLWEKGIRPTQEWVVNWYRARTGDHPKTASAQARLWERDHWMEHTVLPAMDVFPDYAQLYTKIAKSNRLSMNVSRAPRLDRLLVHMPELHLAAAWHNDPCWLAVPRFDDPVWCDYMALYRLCHPQSFYHLAPELEHTRVNAPHQDVWSMACSLQWSWATLLDQVRRLGQPEEPSLALPVDILDT